MAWIAGQGNTVEVIDYQYQDETIVANTTYYYRLKQIDFDGQHDFSDVISLAWEDDKQLAVGELSPNPSYTDQVTLPISVSVATDAILSVFDGAGKMVLQQETQLGTGEHQLSIETASFISGTYFVKIQTGDTVNYRKLMVTRL